MSKKIAPNKPLHIYNASAGSGKTYTLVQEYLRIILHSKDPFKFKSILAMTFTNKAANEMKERILKALIDLKTPNRLKTVSQIQFLKDTATNLKLPEELVTDRAKNILNKILHNYSSFAVLTIDKFTHKIIRTFARDLGVSIDFDVELDVKTLRKNATDLLFDNIGRNKELTRLMFNYAKDNLEEDKSWNFSSQLFEFSDLLFKEDALKSIELLKNLDQKHFDKVRQDIKTENAVIKNELISQGQQAIDVIKSKGLIDDDFIGKSKGVYSFFKRISTGNFTKASNTVIKYVEADDWAHKDSSKKTIVAQIKPVLEQYFNQIVDRFQNELKTYNLNKEIYKNLNNLSLLKHLLKIVDEVKEDQNILLISDFYQKISNLIVNEPIPFIYEHLGTRFEHFLLDEFQDTSKLQWVNMVPLVHNALASRNQNLIVGDGKQAIYRWRNGEVEQFTKLPDEILNTDHIESLKEAEVLFKSLGQKIELDDNYRSAKEIVYFNNKLFTFLTNHLPPHLQYIYKDVKQNPKKNHRGYIKALFDDIDNETQLDFIFDAVQQSLEAGFELKDICVIVRKNADGAAVANFLANKNINVISPDSLFIGKDLTVKFLYRLMSALIQLKNKNYKLKALEHYANINNQSPHKTIEEAEGRDIKTFFESKGIKLPNPQQFHNLYEFVEALILQFNFDPTHNIFLQFFLELVHQYETTNNSNIRDFLQWFKDKGQEKSIVSPEGANAVQIMSIHKSKGLQFPVVICPFFKWSFELNRQVAWVVDEQLKLPAFFVKMNNNIKDSILNNVYTEEEGKYYLDQINLIYVAFTRAETALFMCGPYKASNNDKKTTPIKRWLQPFFEQADFFNKHNNTYELGSLINEVKHKDKKSPTYTLNFLKQVMNKPQLSYKSGLKWEVHTIDVKRNFGTLLHKVLSKLKTKNDLYSVLEQFQTKGIINESLKQDIKSYISDLFKDEHFLTYFSPKLTIYNEVEIVNLKGFKQIPDKVIIDNDNVLVVDFKTGRPTEKHIKQLKEYVKLYQSMGYKNVNGELFYTENKKVKRI